MSVESKAHFQDFLHKKQKKFPLGSDVDKEEIFDYPYLIDKATIAFLKKHGHIMFIIRGPNSTLKSYLSEMIMTRFPSSQLCCADKYFSQTFSPPSRNKETLKQSHIYCQKKVEDACKKNESPIIIQNTHMRKWELQKHLDFAAVYNYTVIMAITLYKFEVTPEALEKINPDGLNLKYFRNRLQQWEDIPPLLTAWFLSPADATFILKSLKKTLSALLDDGKFCHVFDCYDNDTISECFACRRNLYCVAGFSSNSSSMKDYYLSDIVQGCYGKSYSITISGYLITESGITAIVHINEEMTFLEFRSDDSEESICEQFNLMGLDDNIHKYESLVSFPHEDVAVEENNFELEDWLENEVIDLKNCRLIHVAKKKMDTEPFDIRKVTDAVFKKLHSFTNNINFTIFEDVFACRLPENEWLVKLPQKIKVKTLFTGLYV